MNHRLLLRVTAPAVAVGLLLFAACFASVRYMNQLQSNLAAVVSDSAASMEAAQELQICVRQLRFHTLMYLMEPRKERRKEFLDKILDDEQRFEQALDTADRVSRGADESECVRKVRTAYEDYQKDQETLRKEGKLEGLLKDYPKINDEHPIKVVVDPCHDLVGITKAKMDKTVRDSQEVRREGFLAMLVLGLAGPIGGLVTGFGVARGLRRSIYRLSVRVQDIAERLDQGRTNGTAHSPSGPHLFSEDVGSVNVVADGDLHSLDRQMQHIVTKIEGVAARLQQQQRELVRAEQLAAVGQLAAGVAHEIRNPLTGIKMLVEAALRSEPADGPVAAGETVAPCRLLNGEDLRVIHGEITKLEKTVQGFLNFARLPAPQRSPCDLRDLVREARDLVRGRAEHQCVDVSIHVPNEPVTAAVDRGQIGTVLVNLLLNALDATPVTGRVDVVLDQPPSGTVRLTVSDTGAGIPEAVLGRLFTPFVTSKPAGTGLGLSLSARILEEHGGAISGGNRPEGGARFVLTLPVANSALAPEYRDERTRLHGGLL
jgi:signal transduction histidine kinase